MCNSIKLKDSLGKIFLGFESNNASLIIPILQKVQETLGYLPPETIKPIADYTNTSISKIYGVVTFYSQFYMEPRGKNIIKVCRGTACHVRGAEKIIEKTKELLDVEDGKTTKDGVFTMETVACLGACALAPLLVVGNEYHGKMTPEQVTPIINSYK